jgi:flagellar biosynthesis protein FlhB
VSDASEKPFEATPRRIVKAKREGNVARSGELSANLAFAGAGLTIIAIAPSFGAAACNAFALMWTTRNGAAVALVFAIALLPVGAAAGAGALGSMLQSGGLVTTAITLKFERLSPLDGLKRILSRETLAHSLRAVVAFTCATAAMVPFVAWSASELLRATTPSDAAAAAWKAARGDAGAAFAVGICFAIAEYAAARRLWLQRLRMSFDERKREAREEEGDASARGRRRALHRALLRSGLQRMRDAAFVVANPRHIAVALEYRPPDVPVPRVLVRAADAAAVRVRSIAAGYGIPVVENVRLAHALYRDGRAGQPIPHAHYVAVAEVVTALMRAKEIVQ